MNIEHDSPNKERSAILLRRWVRELQERTALLYELLDEARTDRHNRYETVTNLICITSKQADKIDKQLDTLEKLQGFAEKLQHTIDLQDKLIAGQDKQADIYQRMLDYYQKPDLKTLALHDN